MLPLTCTKLLHIQEQEDINIKMRTTGTENSLRLSPSMNKNPQIGDHRPRRREHQNGNHQHSQLFETLASHEHQPSNKGKSPQNLKTINPQMALRCPRHNIHTSHCWEITHQKDCLSLI